MTGGLAWVYDEDGDFLSSELYHRDFLIPESCSDLDAEPSKASTDWSSYTPKKPPAPAPTRYWPTGKKKQSASSA